MVFCCLSLASFVEPVMKPRGRSFASFHVCLRVVCVSENALREEDDDYDDEDNRSSSC